MTTPKPLPPIEMLRSLFDYNPETGSITWRVYRGRCAKVGDVAGSVTPTGYQTICVRNGGTVNYRAHRIAWALHYGEDPYPHELDHIDRDKLNNSITNLRKVTRRENIRNRGAYASTGEKYIQKQHNSYQVTIDRKYIGCCKTLEEAVRLRDEYIRTTPRAL
jgi:hypothetical protein